jgi:hypothetical protein
LRLYIVVPGSLHYYYDYHSKKPVDEVNPELRIRETENGNENEEIEEVDTGDKRLTDVEMYLVWSSFFWCW